MGTRIRTVNVSIIEGYKGKYGCELRHLRVEISKTSGHRFWIWGEQVNGNLRMNFYTKVVKI